MPAGNDNPTIRCGARPSYLWLKDRLDRFVAAVALLVLAPLILCLAWWVRRDGHPALFRQVRAGRDGRPFELLKFRTMRVNVDPFGESPQDGADPRITPAGRTKCRRERPTMERSIASRHSGAAPFMASRPRIGAPSKLPTHAATVISGE